LPRPLEAVQFRFLNEVMADVSTLNLAPAKILLFVAIALGCTAARADWQYTRWGMTHSEVEAAARSAGATLWPEQNVADRKNGWRYRSSFNAGKHSFVVQFQFGQAERLQTVNLALQPEGKEACAEVGADLKIIYGKPVSATAVHQSWIHKAKNNRVEFVHSGSFCFIQYITAAPANKGL
jgi:hypothetical protein